MLKDGAFCGLWPAICDGIFAERFFLSILTAASLRFVHIALEEKRCFMRVGVSPLFYQNNRNRYMQNTANPFLREEQEKQDREQSAKIQLSEEMRRNLRSLKQTGLVNQNNQNNQTLFGVKEPEKTEEEKLLEEQKYNYKDVSSKIQQAKTSSSAGQAVIAATRKVQEIKRKLASGKGDTKELQIALTHAKRMEIVAKRKKHHLEQEELVDVTRKRDEELERREEASRDLRSGLTLVAEEKADKAEDKIFEEREELYEETIEAAKESGAELTEDMMAELNSMISEFGEEELKELEEAMEQLEELEVVDPHMSKEDLEELKRKHRSSEMKAMVKADMDYLKDMIKHLTQGGGAPASFGGNGSSAVVAVEAAAVAVPAGPAVSVSPSPVEGSGFDISV